MCGRRQRNLQERKRNFVYSANLALHDRLGCDSVQITIVRLFWRTAGWLVCALGMVLGATFAAGVLITDGEWWAVPISFFCCTLAGGALGSTWLNHFPNLTISREGILAKRFLRTGFYRWQDFIQAGVIWSHNRGLYFHEIVLLLPGGSKRKKYDSLFFLRNIFHVLYLPYRDDVLTYVLQEYGKLDFCFLNGSETEDYYTIEEQKE